MGSPKKDGRFEIAIVQLYSPRPPPPPPPLTISRGLCALKLYRVPSRAPAIRETTVFHTCPDTSHCWTLCQIVCSSMRCLPRQGSRSCSSGPCDCLQPIGRASN